jgi:hypothetical protein
VNELQLLRRQALNVDEPSEQTRAKARAKLHAHIAATHAFRSGCDAVNSRRNRRRLVAAALVSAAVITAAGVLLTTQLVGGESASAASSLLRQIAGAAAKQPEPAVLAEGQYLYIKSEEAYLSYNTAAIGQGEEYAALVPATREVWLGEHGRLSRTAGEPVFLSQRDHDRWLAAGSPDLSQGVTMDTSLGTIAPPDLPTDPDKLFQRLKEQAAGAGHGLYLEMFVLVGDNLRETLASSALRAALYEVAARIPGVEVGGDVVDSAGRNGIAFSMADETDHTRHTLIIDPETAQLLEERDVVLDSAFELGYPAGTVIGHATYLFTTPVANNYDRPEPER